MAPQTLRWIAPSGHGPYLRVLAAPGRCARLGLGRPRTSRQLPLNHLEQQRPGHGGDRDHGPDGQHAEEHEQRECEGAVTDAVDGSVGWPFRA